MRGAYQRLALLFTRVCEHEFRTINKSEPTINIRVNTSAGSLILAIDPDDRKQFSHTEKFKNLNITKVSIGIDGVEKMNALYADGMRKRDMFKQLSKMFGENGVF